MKNKKINWTNSQRDAIKERDTDLLVSASAGAGKTTVMIERIASMIENKEADISDILVLTFTNASAADMKLKLQKRLGVFLDTASIGTFHKFCGELVRTYFNVVGLSPDFEILGDVDAGIIKAEILNAVITINYDKHKNVIDTFCVNRTDMFNKLLVSIHDFLATRENADEWLESTALASYTTDIAMQNILDYYNRAGEYYLTKFRSFEPDLFVDECITLSTQIMNVKNYDDLHRIALTANFSRLKPKADEDFKNIRDKFKEVVKKITNHYSITYAEIQKNQQQDKELVTGIIQLAKEFDTRYSSAKASQNKLDFNDLEKYACLVLADSEVVITVRQKYKYIFIDEYQDTNPMQERILATVGAKQNIFMVGDVKQSIYGFRGCEATIFAGKMTDFEKNLQGKVVKLNENFRSESNILKFVNSVFGKIMKDNVADIDYNKTSKFSVDNKTSGSVEVSLINTKGGTAVELQSAIIADRIASLVKEGANPKDIAILSRSRTHFDELLTVLRNAGIPACVNSEMVACELFEIALLSNMLYAVSNHYNDVPLVLLMSSFIFGFTPDELAEIKLSGTEDCFYKLLKNVESEKVKSFLRFLDKYRILAKTHNVADVITVFLTEYQITDKLLILPHGRTMVQNIHSYLDIIRGAYYATTVSGFLYLMENQMLDIKIKPPVDMGDCVQIMTMHASKGLEFPTVFIYDAGAAFNVSDTKQLMVIDKKCGLCIYSLDVDEFVKTHSIARLGAIQAVQRVMIAEEMRLLYVALTRAKNNLIIVGGCNLDKMTSDCDDYDILCSKSYLHFLAPTIFASVRDNCFSIETKNAEEIEIIDKEMKGRVLTGKYDKEVVDSLKKTYIKPYPHRTDVLTKNSVTSLVHTDQKYQPTSYVGAEYGTAVHREMQKLDIVELENIIPVIKGAKVYRELMFLQGLDDGMLVQGVIDLLAINGDGAILIDYKTTSTTEHTLVQLYKPQLDMYKAAVSKALPNIRNLDSYIYSTALKKLIKV